MPPKACGNVFWTFLNGCGWHVQKRGALCIVGDLWGVRWVYTGWVSTTSKAQPRHRNLLGDIIWPGWVGQPGLAWLLIGSRIGLTETGPIRPKFWIARLPADLGSGWTKHVRSDPGWTAWLIQLTMDRTVNCYITRRHKQVTLVQQVTCTMSSAMSACNQSLFVTLLMFVNVSIAFR